MKACFTSTAILISSAAADQNVFWFPKPCDEVGRLPPPLSSAFRELNRDVDINNIYADVRYNMAVITGTGYSYTTQGSDPVSTLLLGTFRNTLSDCPAAQTTSDAVVASIAVVSPGSSATMTATDLRSTQSSAMSSAASVNSLTATTLLTTTKTAQESTIQTVDPSTAMVASQSASQIDSQTGTLPVSNDETTTDVVASTAIASADPTATMTTADFQSTQSSAVPSAASASSSTTQTVTGSTIQTGDQSAATAASQSDCQNVSQTGCQTISQTGTQTEAPTVTTSNSASAASATDAGPTPECFNTETDLETNDTFVEKAAAAFCKPLQDYMISLNQNQTWGYPQYCDSGHNVTYAFAIQNSDNISRSWPVPDEQHYATCKSRFNACWEYCPSKAGGSLKANGFLYTIYPFQSNLTGKDAWTAGLSE